MNSENVRRNHQHRSNHQVDVRVVRRRAVVSDPVLISALSDHEKERLIQQQYGREKLLVLSAKDSKEDESMKQDVADKPVTRQESDRRASLRNAGTDKSVKKVQKIGHEACLAKVVYERRKVEILFTDGTSVTGELLEFDKYSVRVRESNDGCAWYFKSAMKGFREVQ